MRLYFFDSPILLGVSPIVALLFARGLFLTDVGFNLFDPRLPASVYVSDSGNYARNLGIQENGIDGSCTSLSVWIDSNYSEEIGLSILLISRRKRHAITRKRERRFKTRWFPEVLDLPIYHLSK